MFLKQSTAVTIVMGPALDSTDGNTQETALTISQADVRLSKNGGAFAQKNDATSASHMEVGNYSVPLNVTDTGTVGHLRVAIHEAGSLAMWRDFFILPAAIYDWLVGTVVNLPVNVEQWNTNNVTDNDIARKTTLAKTTDITGFNDISAAAVNNEVSDVLLVDTFAEPAAVPAATSSIKDKINWVFTVLRNKITQTATTQLVRNDADSATIGTSTISDDGTTFTRGEFS